MRFFTYQQDGIRGLGLRMGDDLYGILESSPAYPGGLEDLISKGMAGLDSASKTLMNAPLTGDFSYLPTIPSPGKIICVGLNYADHTTESGYDQPDYPTLFPRFTTSLVAHDQDMIAPLDLSDTLDFEGEVAVIIGTGGSHISKEDALGHVAGYALFNDGSVRDYQFKSPQWTVGKNFDGTGAFGPDFITADELPEGARNLKIETRLNGKTVQSANTDQLIFDVPTLISVISEAITLEPADVIVTGTPSGIGHARTPKLYMQPGDICEVEVEGMGVLKNRIAAAPGLTSGERVGH
ncbi:MAG: fumarylacetoacetate hydrolase family protein [Pseudomonadota bacterium]